MNYKILQLNYNKVYSFFKSACEPFDEIEINGDIVNVIFNNNIIETYYLKDLKI